MRVRYDRDEGFLTIEAAADNIDFAEEVGPVIVHFSKEREPVLLEILHASGFLTSVPV
jgi:uncharacterized protein YuzE